MEEEIWKDIIGFEGLYQVSNMGRVKGLLRTIIKKNRYGTTDNYICKEKILKPRICVGYIYVCLSVGGVSKGFRIHRLMAQAFIPNLENKPCINHKNGIKTDNRLDNLEWATIKENCIHSWSNNLSKLLLNKPVLQHALDGTIIREFESITLAANTLKTTRSNISRCCHNNKFTALGFMWSFKENKNYN